ncbi:hypothetical protein [Glycomyces sp. NPDC048151]|uniref:hypothetical protein n=1 Tax=Glycomyces sp. NPDC048151 TaxID=3364002 RepID=UPI0037181E58
MATSPTQAGQADTDPELKKAAVSTVIPTESGVIRLTRRNTSATFAIQQNN